ncbi:unnamed protein product [Peronospora destructor]|uniref:GPI ethanolamine phosphate transferase 1 n=1 Tax=Peronospora destructor TaxID=86335 RepID=A0AAV0VBA2_9STRA|nr:unnamed protein product [Peronospora destructor]
MLAFAPSFILLSIAYEVLFYVVLGSVLVSWLLLEAQTSLKSSMWREVQRAFVFLLLVKIAFFVSAEAQKPRLPAARCFLLVVAMSDVLALHFLFLVKNEGSWKEIGNSISMFGINKKHQ